MIYTQVNAVSARRHADISITQLEQNYTINQLSKTNQMMKNIIFRATEIVMLSVNVTNWSMNQVGSSLYLVQLVYDGFFMFLMRC